MVLSKIYFICLLLVGLVCSSPVTTDREDYTLDFEYPIGYIHNKIEDFLNSFVDEDNFIIFDDIEINRNSIEIEKNVGRSLSFEDKIENFIKTHDATFKIPLLGKIKIETKNLQNEEIGVNFKFGNNEVEEARKSKLKKILTPILVFFLLKAITLVPLALGVLLLKAWNSLQLSVFSFVISSGLAIFQLCRKIAENNAQAQIHTNGPWEQQALSKHGRAFGNNLAYSAYTKTL